MMNMKRKRQQMPGSESSKKARGAKEGIVEPDVNDVISGRGDTINRHPGNVNFRKLVEQQRRVYLTSHFKREKRMIAETIVATIKALDPPGRFLSKDPRTGLWLCIDEEKAREKTSQALRENSKRVRAELESEMLEKRKREASNFPNSSSGQVHLDPRETYAQTMYQQEEVQSLYPSQHGANSWSYPYYYGYPNGQHPSVVQPTSQGYGGGVPAFLPQGSGFYYSNAPYEEQERLHVSAGSSSYMPHASNEQLRRDAKDDTVTGPTESEQEEGAQVLKSKENLLRQGRVQEEANFTGMSAPYSLYSLTPSSPRNQPFFYPGTVCREEEQSSQRSLLRNVTSSPEPEQEKEQSTKKALVGYIPLVYHSPRPLPKTYRDANAAPRVELNKRVSSEDERARMMPRQGQTQSWLQGVNPTPLQAKRPSPVKVPQYNAATENSQGDGARENMKGVPRVFLSAVDQYLMQQDQRMIASPTKHARHHETDQNNFLPSPVFPIPSPQRNHHFLSPSVTAERSEFGTNPSSDVSSCFTALDQMVYSEDTPVSNERLFMPALANKIQLAMGDNPSTVMNDDGRFRFSPFKKFSTGDRTNTTTASPTASLKPRSKF